MCGWKQVSELVETEWASEREYEKWELNLVEESSFFIFSALFTTYPVFTNSHNTKFNVFWKDLMQQTPLEREREKKNMTTQWKIKVIMT